MDNLVSNIKKYADKEYPIILEMKNNENISGNAHLAKQTSC